jgi:phosphatidylglycerol---prolipoprotein diacylglyceryl transferase
MRQLLLAHLPQEWGWLLLPTYKMWITAALLLPCWWIVRRLTRQGWAEADALRPLVWAVLAAFLGARVLFDLEHLAFSSFSIVQLLDIWNGGYSLCGGALFASGAAWLSLFRMSAPMHDFADAGAPAMGLGLALSRIGCLMEGCDFGRVAELPWSLRFPKGTPAFMQHESLDLLPPESAFSLPVHPLQLYEALLGLLLMLFALYWTPRRSFHGQVYLLVVLFYCIARFGLDFLRDPWMSAAWGRLLTSQVLALVGIVVSMLLYVRFRKAHAL